MRRGIICILIFNLFLAQGLCFGQKSNRPNVKASQREQLGERDNSFGDGGGRRKFFSFKIFGKKKKFGHNKKRTRIPSPTKKKRDAFQKKRYTGKKGIFGKRKSGWGAKSFGRNGKEDKRLFKAPKNKAKSKRKRR